MSQKQKGAVCSRTVENGRDAFCFNGVSLPASPEPSPGLPQSDIFPCQTFRSIVSCDSDHQQQLTGQVRHPPVGMVAAAKMYCLRQYGSDCGCDVLTGLLLRSIADCIDG